MPRTLLFAIAAGLLLAAAPARAQYPYISAYATCSSPDSFYVIIPQFDPYADPYAYPNWMGYDILRSAVPGCGAPERINADIIPRVFGTTTYYFGGTAPSPGALYVYSVQPVDADHQLVSIPGFCQPCVAYETCTPAVTPFTVGTLTDIGFAVLVNPCPGSCYPSAYVEGPQRAPLLPYVGTSTIVRLYGQANCGTVEGCSLTLDHFDIGPCEGITAASSRTWGQVKIRYR